MSNFSTGTSSTALCTHQSATDFRLAFVMQSGVWSMSSCPLRPLWINIYLSWVATHSQYKSVPCDPDQNTQAHFTTKAMEHPGKHFHGIWAHCRFTCLLLMQMIRTVKFLSHLIIWKQRFLSVLWKEKVLVPQASKGKWAKRTWHKEDILTLWEASWLHWVGTSLGLPFRLAGCSLISHCKCTYL